ncbi:hypothetical protein E2C01_062821 [Portunus trituberculatus]|uniref:Uncharacterized protein n=1 Tax=Portunus trituberculatus TaxID=210409 RepID=A0A5B7HFY7_PORTR|nr:hypothetical protein [Portunus trituberculatus]
MSRLTFTFFPGTRRTLSPPRPASPRLVLFRLCTPHSVLNHPLPLCRSGSPPLSFFYRHGRLTKGYKKLGKEAA